MNKSDEELKQRIDEIQGEIDVLRSQKWLKHSKCDICNNDKCEVISFTRRKPVHVKCHWLEMEKLGLFKN